MQNIQLMFSQFKQRSREFAGENLVFESLCYPMMVKEQSLFCILGLQAILCSNKVLKKSFKQLIASIFFKKNLVFVFLKIYIYFQIRKMISFSLNLV